MEFDSSLFTSEVIWFILGVALMLLELVAPGLILIFFGIGAWITSATVLILDIGLNAQLLVFAISSITSLLSLRQSIKKRYMDVSQEGDDKLDHEFIGGKAVTLTPIQNDRDGKVEYNGSQWEAISEFQIKANETVRIIGMKSIKLIVEPFNK